MQPACYWRRSWSASSTPTRTGSPPRSARACPMARPHTTEPLAGIPEGAEASLMNLLESLGVTSVKRQSKFPGLAVLDMTDVDSLESSHRRRGEDLLPVVDVGVWGVDSP